MEAQPIFSHSKRRNPTFYIARFQGGLLFPAAQIGLTSCRHPALGDQFSNFLHDSPAPISSMRGITIGVNELVRVSHAILDHIGPSSQCRMVKRSQSQPLFYYSQVNDIIPRKGHPHFPQFRVGPLALGYAGYVA